MAFSETEKKQDKKEKPMTKVIIRRLPPTMEQETFLNQVSPIPDYNYIYLVKGDSSLGEYAFTRVYINFVNAEDIYDFKERFDNYVFVDGKGNEYPAVVEFAPFQKIPKKRGKVRMDPKSGSIESDPIYQEFVESLSKPKEQDEKPEYTLQLSSVSSENKNDITTPLLEYIKNKRAQRMRVREVRREERKRREFERKKERYDDRKKSGDEKLPGKNLSSKQSIPKLEVTEEENCETQEIAETKGVEKREKIEKATEKFEKVEKTFEKSYYNKNKDRKYEDRKYDDRKYEDRKYDERKFDDRRKDIKPRYPRKDYSDNRDYKRADDYRPKYEDYKKEEKGYPKKVKKYSERREERKMEVQKAEQLKNEKLSSLKKEEKSEEIEEKSVEKFKSVTEKVEASQNKIELDDKNKEILKTQKVETKSKENENIDKKDLDSKIHENNEKKKDEEQKEKDLIEPNSQRRIRNKDRPTIAIYRPGMLSKRKQTETDSTDTKEIKN